MFLRLLPFGFMMLLTAAAVSAAPKYPFPASKRAVPDWWKSAARLPLNDPDIGQVSFGWDAEALYLHVSEAAQAGTIAMQVPAGERRVTWQNGSGRVTTNGKELSPVSVTNGGTRAIDAAIRWADLGLKPGAQRAFPLSLGWGASGGPSRWLPEAPIWVNVLSFGVLFLNDGEPLAQCAPTLTRPFVFRFDPTHKRGVLTVQPEPVSGLLLPVEVTERAIGVPGVSDRVLRTREVSRATRIELANASDASAVGVVLRVPLYGASVPESEYRTLNPGVTLEKYAGMPGWTEAPDFEGFWARARADLGRTPMNARITEVKDRSTPTGRLYRVELDSLDNVTIVCWYFVPKDVNVPGATKGRQYPAVQIMPGYGAEEPPIDRTADGYVTLSVNPRGHGPSGAYWPLPGDHLNWNILDPEKYYYRGAYMDCVRAMQFLMSRPEVDTSRVGVEGSSQGGALALATAALDNRVAACSADVPFLCDFPSGVVLFTRGGLSGLRARFEASTPEGEAVRRTLSYIDGSFMAAHIQCPTLIAVGQMDRTCPPQGGAAAYNHLSHRIERKFMAVTNRDHEVMPEWRTATDAWFRKFLK